MTDHPRTSSDSVLGGSSGQYPKKTLFDAASAKVAESLKSLESSTDNVPSISVGSAGTTVEEASTIEHSAIRPFLQGALECFKNSNHSTGAEIDKSKIGVYLSITPVSNDSKGNKDSARMHTSGNQYNCCALCIVFN